MARQLTSADLRRLADSLDEEERDEASEATRAQLEELTGREHLTNEEVARIREFFNDLDTPEEEPGEPPEPPELTPAPEPAPEPAEPEEPAEPAPGTRTRPGRKNGRAYDWEPDPDTGEPVRTSFAKIWSGEDEPDQVELAPAPEPEPEEEAAA